MNILAIDYGEKRIGTAVGSTEDGIAFPREIISVNTASDIILSLCDLERIDLVLVGLPIFPRNQESKETENARNFAKRLKDLFDRKKIKIPIQFWDERYSSKTAIASAKSMGLSDRGIRGRIDNASAAIFLQVYLDSVTKI